jgi:Planctomycete cytochrome C
MVYTLRISFGLSIVGFIGLIASLSFIGACKHEPLFPKVTNPPGDDTTDYTGVPCNPNVVYFNQQVLPILISRCAIQGQNPGCHSAADHQEGIVLTSYFNVMNTADIQGFDLNHGDVWEVINETDPDKQMPPPGNVGLTQAEKDLIMNWILQGAQNLMCDDNLGPCDTTAVTFSGVVKPLLDSKCKGCHRDGLTNGNVNFTVYSGVAVVAGNQKLMKAIEHTGPANTFMPPGGKLNNCEISKINTWVNQGYPNN